MSVNRFDYTTICYWGNLAKKFDVHLKDRFNAYYFLYTVYLRRCMIEINLLNVLLAEQDVKFLLV